MERDRRPLLVQLAEVLKEEMKSTVGDKKNEVSKRPVEKRDDVEGVLCLGMHPLALMDLIPIWKKVNWHADMSEKGVEKRQKILEEYEKMCAAKLTYFDGRGRAELIRLTMVAAGIDWSENFIHTKEDMDRVRSTGKLLFNQLPLLEINGLSLVQSDAIVRYIAAKHQLLGGSCPAANDNSDLSVRINMLYCGARDFMEMSFLSYGFKPYDEVLQVAKTKAIPKYMPVFEQYLARSKSGYLAGTKMTIADIALFEVLLWINELCANELKPFPEIKKFFQKMSNDNRFSKYLNSEKRRRINDDRYVKEVKESLGWN